MMLQATELMHYYCCSISEEQKKKESYTASKLYYVLYYITSDMRFAWMEWSKINMENYLLLNV